MAGRLSDEDDFWGFLPEKSTSAPNSHKSPSPAGLEPPPRNKSALSGSVLDSTPTPTHSDGEGEGRSSSSRSYNSDSFISDSEEERQARDARAAAVQGTPDTGKGDSLNSIAQDAPHRPPTSKSKAEGKPKVKKPVKKRRRVVKVEPMNPKRDFEGYQVSQLPNNAGLLKQRLAESMKECRILKQVNRRQEVALQQRPERSRFSPSAQRQSEETRVLREAGREKRNEQERILRERNDALQRALRRISQLEGIVSGKGIDISKQRKQAHARATLRQQLEDNNHQIEELKGALLMSEKNARHQLSIEVQRHRETQAQLQSLVASQQSLTSHRKNVGKISRTKKSRKEGRRSPPAPEDKDVPADSAPKGGRDYPAPLPASSVVSPDTRLPPHSQVKSGRKSASAPRKKDVQASGLPDLPSSGHGVRTPLQRLPSPERLPRPPSLTVLPSKHPQQEQEEILASLTRNRSQALGELEMPWGKAKATPSDESLRRTGYTPAGVEKVVGTSSHSPKPKPPTPLDLDSLFGPRVPRRDSGRDKDKPKTPLQDLFGPTLNSRPPPRKDKLPWEQEW